MPIIVFQHFDMGRPGRLGLTLRDHGFSLDIRRLDQGDTAPADYDDVEGVISLGGPQNVADGLPWIAAEMDYLRGAHARALPVVGICLGHQLIAAALGGKVAPAARAELGPCEVNLTAAGQTDPILAGIPWRTMQFQSHAQEVTEPPPGSAVLASSSACRIQAMRVGMRTYSFQYHFELDRETCNEYMARESAADLAACGTSMDDYRVRMDRCYELFARSADRLCVNLATFLFARPALRLAAR